MCLLTLRYLLLVYLNYLKYEVARRSLKGAQSYFIYVDRIENVPFERSGKLAIFLHRNVFIYFILFIYSFYFWRSSARRAIKVERKYPPFGGQGESMIACRVLSSNVRNGQMSLSFEKVNKLRRDLTGAMPSTTPMTVDDPFVLAYLSTTLPDATNKEVSLSLPMNQWIDCRSDASGCSGPYEIWCLAKKFHSRGS